MVQPQTLGKAIRERRIELGMTQEELAAQIGEGVRQSEVSRLERDRIVLPRRERLVRIAAALQMPVGELLVRSGWTGAQEAVRNLAPALRHSPEEPDLHDGDSASRDSEYTRLRVAIEQARYQTRRTQEILNSLASGLNPSELK
jgi:transcriptional regulator with XRE-family HTH domain